MMVLMLAYGVYCMVWDQADGLIRNNVQSNVCSPLLAQSELWEMIAVGTVAVVVHE